MLAWLIALSAVVVALSTQGIPRDGHRHRLVPFDRASHREGLAAEQRGAATAAVAAGRARPQWGEGAFAAEALLVVQSPATEQQGVVVASMQGESENRSASLRELAWVCIASIVPLCVAWLGAFQTGTVAKHYGILLPLTLCIMIIQTDLINQSLSVWMQSPMGITAFQAATMSIVGGLITPFMHFKSPIFSWQTLSALATYSPAAVAYVVFQLVNHQVSYACSLSERVVFMNLCPAMFLLLESLIMPAHLQQKVSRAKVLSLGAMVLGVGMFALQYPNFTWEGIVAATVLISVVIPYRLLQRFALSGSRDLPVPFLCVFDGALLAAPSATIMELNLDTFWAMWAAWFEIPYITAALLMSTVCFSALHFSTLYVLRETSATSFQVYYNMANFVLVLLGVVLYNDRVLDGPLVMGGIIVSLAGGVSYAMCSEAEEPAPKSDLPAKLKDPATAQAD